jgi:hypothetical protein
VRPGDLVAFVGAGDIDQKAREWLARRAGPADTGPRWDELAAAWQSQLSHATKLLREEPLAPKTTMRVGGAARLYAEPADVEDLRTLVRAAHAAGLPLYLLGRGSNLIVPDEGVDGLVIALAHRAWATFEARPEGRVWAGAGLRLKNLCGLALQAGLAGFEFLEGIPGSVGGRVAHERRRDGRLDVRRRGGSAGHDPRRRGADAAAGGDGRRLPAVRGAARGHRPRRVVAAGGAGGRGGDRPPDRHLPQPAARIATARAERGLRVQKSAGRLGRPVDRRVRPQGRAGGRGGSVAPCMPISS